MPHYATATPVAVTPFIPAAASSTAAAWPRSSSAA